MNLEEKVEKLYSNQYFEKIRTKKFITMLKVIVLDKEKNLDKIASKSGLSKVTVKKYLKGDELFSRFLTNYEYEEFLLYVKDIKDYEKSKLEEEKYFLAKNLINDILTTRYSIDEIYTRNYTTPYFADIILKDNKYLEENFGADIVNEIKFRIAETTIVRQSLPRDKVLIEDEWDLEIVKDKIHYLSNVEAKLVKVASNYIMTQADIGFVSSKLQMPERSIIMYLTDSRLKDLLKESYYKQLNNYLKIENILIKEDLNKKRDLIVKIVESLKENNFSIDMTILQNNISYPLLKKILSNPLLSILYPREDIGIIEKILNEENDDIKVSEESIKKR